MKLKNLRDLTSKGYREAFLSNKYLFRHISVYISYVCIKFKISANFITFLSLLAAVVGAYLQYSSNFNVLTISCILLLIYYLLDMVDGEIARYNAIILNKNNGKAGAYFDAYVHYILTPVLFMAIGIFSYMQYDSLYFVWLGLLVGMWLSSYAQSAAYRVIFDAMLSEKGSESKAIHEIWSHDKVDRKEVSLKTNLRYIIREIFSSQGQIFCITVAIILDWYLVFDYSFRTIYLLMMGIIALISMPRVFLRFFEKLKHVS